MDEISEKLNLSIKSNLNNVYSINFYANSKSFLQIDVYLKDKIIYEENFSLGNIKTLSKYFSLCNSISDVLISLEPNIQNYSNIKLLEENNHLYLIIPLNHPLSPQISFYITKKEDISGKINDIYKIIKKQQNEIKQLKKENEDQQRLIIEQLNEINQLKKENQDQYKLINEQQIDIINLSENFKNLKSDLYIKENNSEKKEEKKEKEKEEEEEEDGNGKNLINISKIIPNDYEKEKVIKEWINPDKIITFELLFRKSENGSKGKDFHNKCDNKGPTLTLIETDKGKKFGGYTPINWGINHNDSANKTDKITFLFSLNSMTQFTKCKEGKSIYSNKICGPSFGSGTDLYICNNMDEGNGNSGNYLENNELTDGEKNFKVKEIEVFKVEFK